MNDAPHTDGERRADAQLLTAMLGASVRVLGPWSLVISALALAALVWRPSAQPWPWPWLLVLAAGVGERYLAWRLALDERLFALLGRGDLGGLEALDGALQRLGLRRADPAAPRPWLSRVRGTQRLLRAHLLVALLQTTALLFACCWRI